MQIQGKSRPSRVYEDAKGFYIYKQLKKRKGKIVRIVNKPVRLRLPKHITSLAEAQKYVNATTVARQSPVYAVQLVKPVNKRRYRPQRNQRYYERNQAAIDADRRAVQDKQEQPNAASTDGILTNIVRRILLTKEEQTERKLIEAEEKRKEEKAALEYPSYRLNMDRPQIQNKVSLFSGLTPSPGGISNRSSPSDTPPKIPPRPSRYPVKPALPTVRETRANIPPIRIVDIAERDAYLKNLMDNAGVPDQYEPSQHGDESFEAVVGTLNNELDDVLDEKHVGNGSSTKKYLTALWNDQIDDYFADEPKFIGTISSDEIKTLKRQIPSGFVMNTSPSTELGEHWVSVYIGPDSIEYYDPEALPPTDKFVSDIRKLMTAWKMPTMMKLKINRVKDQKNGTNYCGYHAMRFLDDRFHDIPYKLTTRFDMPMSDESQQGCADIRKEFEII